jgi:NADH:ubiquinone oxidoreductase subunit
MSVSKEVWKPIKGYEGLYEVSNLGRVRKRVWKEVKGTDFCNGYRRVNLNKDGEQKSMLVHRLVAEAFIPNPEGYPIINHIDECPSNNHADNLEWCDQKHNMNCGTVRQKKSESAPNKSAVMAIDKKTGERTYYKSIAEAGKALTGKSVGGSSISEVASGKRKSAYGKYWFYVTEDGGEDVCE